MNIAAGTICLNRVQHIENTTETNRWLQSGEEKIKSWKFFIDKSNSITTSKLNQLFIHTSTSTFNNESKTFFFSMSFTPKRFFMLWTNEQISIVPFPFSFLCWRFFFLSIWFVDSKKNNKCAALQIIKCTVTSYVRSYCVLVRGVYSIE